MEHTILIVDDSITARKHVRRELERHGHRVIEAIDGEAALQTLAETTPSLVISDVNMSPMDGLTLLARIRRRFTSKELPVLMLTTEVSDELKAEGRAAGATGWLVKPFDPDRMSAVIAHVLSLSRRSDGGGIPT